MIEKEAMVVPDAHTVLMMHRLKLQAGLWVGASSGVNVQVGGFVIVVVVVVGF